MGLHRRVAVSALLATALLLPAPAGGAPLVAGCGVTTPTVARVEIRADLAGDGEVADVRREVTATDAVGTSCHDVASGDADDLPVAVGVLHATEADGALEVGELGEATGPVTTRVAVRDRTAAPRTLRVDGPRGTEGIERRVGVPSLVRVEVTYPSGWTGVRAAIAGTSTDVVDGGVRVGRSLLLFPPLTDDEVVLPVTAHPGRGAPGIDVQVTPIADAETARVAADELDGDAAAVLAALTEVAADGADQLADGTADLASGIEELAGGAGDLAAGLDEAAAGGASLRDGAAQLAAGAGELAVGTRQLAAGLRPLADGARQVAEGNRALAEQLTAAAAASRQLAAGGDELAAGADQLAAGVDQLSLGLGDVQDELAGVVDDAAPGPVGALLEEVLGPVLDGLAAPLAQLDQLAAGADQLGDGARALADGNRELADGLGRAAGGSAELAAGAERVADGADDAAAGADELADGAEQLEAGADRLAGGVGQATRGVEEAAAGADQLAAGSEDAAAGAGELASGAAELPGALDRATATADRTGARQAEQQAVLALGRRLAAEAVRDATGEAADGTLTTQLVAAGGRPLPVAAFVAAVLVALTATAVGRRWWRLRTPGGHHGGDAA